MNTPKTQTEVYALLARESLHAELPRFYETDLTKHDYNALANEDVRRGFVWILREHGTYLWHASNAIRNLENHVDGESDLLYTFDGQALMRHDTKESAIAAMKQILYGKVNRADFDAITVIDNYWSYLREYGFDRLTSEACGLSMRMLVDITMQAEDILTEFFGCKSIEGQAAWNGNYKSVMIPHALVETLAVYIAVKNNPDKVILTGHGHIAICDNHETANAYIAWYDMIHDYPADSFRVYQASKQPGNGLRHTHAFSGRIV